MKNIFIGFIFIFLDFSLNIGKSKIGLIPDFVGYIVLAQGLVEMERDSILFMKVHPFAACMGIYSGILYLFDIAGVSVLLGDLTYVLAFTTTAISLYISYNIVMGVIDMEKKYNKLLNGDNLKSIWILLAVFDILTIVTLMIPTVTIFCIIISFIITFCFLFAFNNSKNMYYNTVR